MMFLNPLQYFILLGYAIQGQSVQFADINMSCSTIKIPLVLVLYTGGTIGMKKLTENGMCIYLLFSFDTLVVASSESTSFPGSLLFPSLQGTGRGETLGTRLSHTIPIMPCPFSPPHPTQLVALGISNKC